MDRLLVRFEQKRGHCMIVTGKQPIRPKDCDDFQIRMLRASEVPGLLKLEAAVLDGEVSFRYKLDGTRMLSALMKAGKWTVAEWLTVLHRLAEILEECRLYMLDEDRICLDDHWIFVGEGWADLRFVYLPLLWEQPPLAERLRLILTRWILHVKEPDGRMLQQMLELLSSPDMKPAALRSFARKHLLEMSLADEEDRARGLTGSAADEEWKSAAAGEIGSASSSFGGAGATFAARTGVGYGNADSHRLASGACAAGRAGDGEGRLDGAEAAGDGASAGSDSDGFWTWRWGRLFRSGASPMPGALNEGSASAFASVPPESSMQPIGGSLRRDLSSSPSSVLHEASSPVWPHGDGSDPPEADIAPGDPLSAGEETGQDSRFRQRSKIWLICASAALTAAGWRWGYAEHPGLRGLIFSVGVTLIAAAGALLIWRRLARHDRPWPPWAGNDSPPAVEKPAQPFSGGKVIGGREEGAFRILAEAGQRRSEPMDTVLGEAWDERTQQLSEERKEAPSGHAACLLWETAPGTPLIPITSDSFLIGRSREACSHVDDTQGVSRVHLELIRTNDGWTARDLGSRNGTKLNGVPMVAYAAYPLKPDDCLDLAGSRYRLK